VTLAVSTTLIVIYYVVPIGPLSNPRVLLRLAIGVLIFVSVVAIEVRAILRSDRPVPRAWLSIGIIGPLFLVMFASIYVAMARADPAAFGGELSRTEALYFSITMLSTVGFGDITPKTDPARTVIMIQMVADLVLVGAIVKLISGAASHRSAQVHGQAHEDQPVESPHSPES
jgi:voltage-gated potassium channel